MNTYRNKRTGTFLQTESKVTGDNWELVKKKESKKADGVEETDAKKEPEE